MVISIVIHIFQHVDVIFYYLQKKARKQTNPGYRYITVDYFSRYSLTRRIGIPNITFWENTRFVVVVRRIGIIINQLVTMFCQLKRHFNIVVLLLNLRSRSLTQLEDLVF